MSEILGSVWWMIVTLGLLVTFHEFGHYWVARRCGVRVLRFSIGFGKPLWKRVGRDGTEYVIAAIPLGGYVKMLDAREGEVAAADRGREFTAKPTWQRIAIVAAGPAFNLLFAVAAFWAMLVAGKPDYLPIVGQADRMAAAAGVVAGDRIVSVDGHAVGTWSDVGLALGDAATARRAVTLGVRTPTGAVQTLTLPLQQLPADLGPDASMQRIGLVPKQLMIPAVVGRVEAGSAAARAGFRPGDRVLAIAGQPVRDWAGLVQALQAQAGPRKPLAIAIERGGRRLDLEATPVYARRPDGSSGYLLGIERVAAAPHYDTVQRKGPLAAIPAAFAQTWDLAGQTLGMLGRMVTGQASLKNISGPISIARYANASADLGAAWFLYFLGIVSLSLAIMNLLPIPILDGGHLVYYLIESIKGSPVSERVMAAGQYFGMALLVALMGLAFYNDLLRLAS